MKVKCKNLLGVTTNLNIGNYDEVGIVPGMNMIDEEVALKFPNVFKIIVEDEVTKQDEKENLKEAKDTKTIDVTNDTFEAKLKEEQKDEVTDPVNVDKKDSEIKEIKEEIKEEVKATPNKTTKKSPKKKVTKKKK